MHCLSDRPAWQGHCRFSLSFDRKLVALRWRCEILDSRWIAPGEPAIIRVLTSVLHNPLMLFLSLFFVNRDRVLRKLWSLNFVYRRLTFWLIRWRLPWFLRCFTAALRSIIFLYSGLLITLRSILKLLALFYRSFFTWSKPLLLILASSCSLISPKEGWLTKILGRVACLCKLILIAASRVFLRMTGAAWLLRNGEICLVGV